MFRAYEREGVIVIVPDGELDVTNSMQFKEKILSEYIDQGKTKIVLDMSNVGYMDSSALGVIISIFRHAKMSGGGFAIAGLVDSVRRLFSLTALDKVIPIFSTVEEAVEKIM